MLCSFLFTASLFTKKEEIYSHDAIVNITLDHNLDIEGVESVKNGNGYIASCSYKTYDILKNSLCGVKGITFIYSASQSEFNCLKEKLNILLVEDNYCNFVGYTTNFDKSVNYKNKKVNVQALYKNGKIIIGSPIITGSY